MHEPASILNASPPPPQRTLCVLGLFRGGTTMVARALRGMGVFMGARLDPRGNEEDLDFQHAESARIRELVKARDAAHDVWGWKYPGSFLTILDWYRALRNPRFVLVFRDPLASAQTELASGNASDLAATIATKLDHTGRMLEFVLRANAARLPLCLVSYERAVMDPERFVDQLAEFAGVALAPARRAEVIAVVDPRTGYGTADGKPPK